MGRFERDTALRGGAGRYHAVISPDWEAPFGPLGGYVAAIALRAIGLESPLTRPVSIHCQFLAVPAYAPIEVEVLTLRRGKRSHALQVRMSQDGRLVHAASGWVAQEGMRGLDHDHARMPEVAGPAQLESFAERVENFEEWAAVWRTAIEGRPTAWSDEARPPVSRTWLRLMGEPTLDDPFLDAARSLMWLDLMMWGAAVAPHLPRPLRYIAPNLDLSASFHASAREEDWLLGDASAPVGREGLVGCSSRVWSPEGRLVASGTSSLFCRPNPSYERELAERRRWTVEQSHVES